MNPFFVLAAFLLVYMTSAFVIALIRKDNGTADIAYGGGFVLLAVTALVLTSLSAVTLLMALLVAVWAGRLSLRILKRNRGKEEDFRYKAWRESWGKWFVLRSYGQVYLLQGAVIYIVSLPLLLAAVYAGDAILGLITFAGLSVWVLGFLYESVGDAQLDRFVQNPVNKGRVLQSGLWKYTRHPNYFGESLMWWGIAVMGADALLSTGHAYIALTAFLSPVLITFLLTKVSGIPLVEARFTGKPEWEEYKKRTSAFIPWVPKT